MSRSRIATLVIVAVVGAVAALVILMRVEHWRPASILIEGAVIRQDQDARQELPIAGVTVTASDGVTSATTESDSSGHFALKFRERVWPEETMKLSFRHSDYRPLDLQYQVGLRSNLRRIYIAAMVPAAPENTSNGPESVVSNIRIRYTVNFESEANIGTAVRTFRIDNKGNIPCQHRYPCSPDGAWKASTNSATLDAGQDNEFRNARVSCFAGPCPFTRVDSSGFARGGRIITASALDWSDTATFLFEAEVFHNSTGSSVRESYPLIYGRVLHFTLPANQEGVSIEAEIDGAPMVFPLGPDLYMSWATCSSRAENAGDSSTVFQCELKPGYRF